MKKKLPGFFRNRISLTKVGKSQRFQRVRKLFTKFGESRVVNCFRLPTGKFAGKVLAITLICILADKSVDIITLPFQNRVQLCSILRLLAKMGLRRFGSTCHISSYKDISLQNQFVFPYSMVSPPPRFGNAPEQMERISWPRVFPNFYDYLEKVFWQQGREVPEYLKPKGISH